MADPRRRRTLGYSCGSGAQRRGALLGGLLGDPASLGLDAALAALLLALAMPSRSRPAVQAALVAAAITALLTPFLPAGVPIAAAAAFSLLGAPPVSDAWAVAVALGAATVLLKAAGPVFLGRRPLPPKVHAVVELLASVMLSALVLTQTLAGDTALAIDARALGVAAAAVAIVFRAPIVLTRAIAAVVTALVRVL